MSNRLSRIALAMGFVGAALLAAACGGERQSEAAPSEVIANTELVNLSIEGMT